MISIVIENFLKVAQTISLLGGVFIINKELREYHKNRLANNVSVNRIDWIKDVRKLIFDFIEELYNDNSNEAKLLIIKSHIELYCNKKNPDQVELLNQLSSCIDNKTSKNIESLLNISEKVLSNAWIALKMEVGQDADWHNKNIHSKLYKDYNPNKNIKY